MHPRTWGWAKWLAVVAGCAMIAGLVSFLMWAPAMTAAVCPSCYGLQPVGDRVFVEADMPEVRRRQLLDSIVTAETMVVAFFGSLNRRPIILACDSEDCDKRLGGRGARAVTHSTWNLSVLRLSPRGLTTPIIAHELSHVQVHARIGVLNQMRGVVPAWFDEGLAVVVSADTRYLKPGQSASEKCMPTPEGELPASPFVWGPLSGKTPWIYAKAACHVLQWIENNGGKPGLLAAIADVAQGRRKIP